MDHRTSPVATTRPGAASRGCRRLAVVAVAAVVLSLAPGRPAAAEVTGIDLEVEGRTHASPAVVGEPLTIDVTARNQGPDRAPDVTVRFTAPAGLTVTGATLLFDRSGSGCTVAGQDVVCEAGDLDPTQFDIASVIVLPTTPGTALTPTASVGSSQPERPESTYPSTTTIPIDVVAQEADLYLTLESNVPQVEVGQQFDYAVFVQNFGPALVAHPVVTMELPASFTIDRVDVSFARPGSGCSVVGHTVTCDLGQLPSTLTNYVGLLVTPTAAGRFDTSASVMSDVPEPAPDPRQSADPHTMYVGPAPTSISGTVRSSADGQPVAGIQVRLYRQGQSRSTARTTDAQGRYDFTGLAPGAYQLWFREVNGKRFTSEYWDDRPTLATAEPLAVGVGDAVVADPVLAAIAPKPVPGSIAGRVTDLDGAPIAGLQVRAYPDGATTGGKVATTAADGTYALPGLAAGSYRLWFRDVRSQRWTSEYHHDAASLAEATPVAVAAGRATTVDEALAPRPGRG